MPIWLSTVIAFLKPSKRRVLARARRAEKRARGLRFDAALVADPWIKRSLLHKATEFETLSLRLFGEAEAME